MQLGKLKWDQKHPSFCFMPSPIKENVTFDNLNFASLEDLCMPTNKMMLSKSGRLPMETFQIDKKPKL